MWGKWHLGGDPEPRSPVDFGFDEAVWSPRTADEVLWTMQSSFPGGPVTAAPQSLSSFRPTVPRANERRGRSNAEVSTARGSARGTVIGDGGEKGSNQHWLSVKANRRNEVMMMSGAAYAEYNRLFKERQSKQDEVKQCWGSRRQELEHEIDEISKRLDKLAGEMQGEEEWRNTKFVMGQAGIRLG